jgi:hypothetical protein
MLHVISKTDTSTPPNPFERRPPVYTFHHRKCVYGFVNFFSAFCNSQHIRYFYYESGAWFRCCLKCDCMNALWEQNIRKQKIM